LLCCGTHELKIAHIALDCPVDSSLEVSADLIDARSTQIEDHRTIEVRPTNLPEKFGNTV
jgi:hypothetical protein